MAVQMRDHLMGSVAGELRYEPTVTRVRALTGADVVVDTMRALLVWEPRRIVPVYAVPETDLRHGAVPAEPDPARDDPDRGARLIGPANFNQHSCPGTVMDVGTPHGHLAGAGFAPDDVDLAGFLLLDFSAFDAWLVEDEPRVGHPHDPFKRISVHASSRHVEVSLEGQVLASSTRALMLLETHLPPRWYLPPADVRMDLLQPSDHRTTCAYKGHASYLSLPGIAENIGWHYDDPLDDALRVRGHIAFWNERTDLRLDGEPVPRPVTHWSPPEVQAAAAADEPGWE